jgi:hypothetical protein
MKSLILPHKYQVTGWWLFVMALISFGITLLPSKVLKIIPQNYSQYTVLLSYALGFVSLFLICFSKEKNENERTTQIRLNAALLTAYIIFIAYILLAVVFEYTSIFRLGKIKWLLKAELLIFNPLTICVLYFVFMRIGLTFSGSAGQSEK